MRKKIDIQSPHSTLHTPHLQQNTACARSFVSQDIFFFCVVANEGDDDADDDANDDDDDDKHAHTNSIRQSLDDLHQLNVVQLHTLIAEQRMMLNKMFAWDNNNDEAMVAEAMETNESGAFQIFK